MVGERGRKGEGRLNDLRPRTPEIIAPPLPTLSLIVIPSDRFAMADLCDGELLQTLVTCSASADGDIVDDAGSDDEDDDERCM